MITITKSESHGEEPHAHTTYLIGSTIVAAEGCLDPLGALEDIVMFQIQHVIGWDDTSDSIILQESAIEPLIPGAASLEGYDLYDQIIESFGFDPVITVSYDCKGNSLAFKKLFAAHQTDLAWTCGLPMDTTIGIWEKYATSKLKDLQFEFHENGYRMEKLLTKALKSVGFWYTFSPLEVEITFYRCERKAASLCGSVSTDFDSAILTVFNVQSI
ncbi:MAG: hypothetical protein J0L72_10255 [Armatimonadetes bacterium]|nr:hypothetical protein [Armatimonadota bacterium]